MRVGIVLPYLKAGGTERQALYIARHLRAAGHRVVLVVAEKTGGFAQKVDVETVSLNTSFGKISAPLLLYRLVAVMAERDFDLMLSRAWNTNMLTAVAGLLTGIPYVLFLSGPTHRDGQPRPKLAVEGFLLRRAARILSVSGAAKENCVQAYGMSSSQVEVVHNGIEIEDIRRQSEEEFEAASQFRDEDVNVVFVGRVNHRKGLDILLRAVQRVEAAVPNIKLLVIGPGEIASYRELATELGVEGRVEFLGEKENPFSEMKQADLFVLPSRSEGFPNVLLEAMALGRSVLAADCETGPNEIIDGENGRLFPVEDDRALARHIKELTNDDQKRKKMGARAQATVHEHFRLSTQLSKMEDILSREASVE
jgi:glycosyltransferase involved in cell wall biosynthesis